MDQLASCRTPQMYTYFDKCFPKHRCYLRKRYNVQHCLLVMIEKTKRACAQNKLRAAVLTDLSKALDCLKIDLVIGKSHAFGFNFKSRSVINVITLAIGFR